MKIGFPSMANAIGLWQQSRYFIGMSDLKDKISFKELTESQVAAAGDEHYDSWKDDKIRSALKQSEDRSKMTPAKKVWEKFGFER